MKASYYTPFVNSTRDVFSMMLFTEAKALVPRLIMGRDNSGTYQVYGLIGINGDVTGAMRVKMPESTAVNVVEKLAGEKIELGTEDFADAIGELANMIAGGAKSKMGLASASITTPTVALGKNISLARMQKSVTLDFPHDSDLGVFAIEVTLQDSLS